MARPVTIEDSERVTVVLSKKQADHVRTTAIKMSVKEGRQIGVSEAIRMAIEATYPMPRDPQLNLFSVQGGSR